MDAPLELPTLIARVYVCESMVHVLRFTSLHGISGFREAYLFTTEDLFEGKGMKQVIICLLTLARLAHDFGGYTGPLLGRGEHHGTTEVKHSVQSDSLWGKVGGSYA